MLAQKGKKGQCERITLNEMKSYSDPLVPAQMRQGDLSQITQIC